MTKETQKRFTCELNLRSQRTVFCKTPYRVNSLGNCKQLHTALLCQSGYLVVTVFKEYPRLCEHSVHLYNPIVISGWWKQSVNTYHHWRSTVPAIVCVLFPPYILPLYMRGHRTSHVFRANVPAMQKIIWHPFWASVFVGSAHRIFRVGTSAGACTISLGRYVHGWTFTPGLHVGFYTWTEVEMLRSPSEKHSNHWVTKK